MGNVEKSRRFLRDFSKSLWESALFADFHRDGIFHRPMTLVPKIHRSILAVSRPLRRSRLSKRRAHLPGHRRSLRLETEQPLPLTLSRAGIDRQGRPHPQSAPCRGYLENADRTFRRRISLIDARGDGQAGLRSQGCLRHLGIRLRRPHWSGFRQIPGRGEFEMSERQPGCNRPVKQGDSKIGERKNYESVSGCGSSFRTTNPAMYESGEWRTRKGMFAKLQLYGIAGIRKAKPRINDAGLYQLSSRFEADCIRCWLLR